MRYADRLSALKELLPAPLLVSRAPNLRYLTGFDGSNGYLLVTATRSIFVTDGRYGELAGRLVEELPDTDLEVYTGNLWPALGKVLNGLEAVELEANGVTWSFVRQLEETTEAELRPSEGTVERLRLVKDEEEVGALRRAARAGDVAFGRLLELVEEVDTEAELGDALETAMRAEGGRPADWEPIVAAGAGASLPHYRSGGEAVGTGLLLLDYGCVVGGYHSDMSRTVWLDSQPEPRWVQIHDAVREAQEAAIAEVGPEVPTREVDGRARQVLEAHGLLEHFLHSTGHGVGLEIHEAPRLAQTSDEVLEIGNVVTVEPGVYLPGEGGVRIEDMVLVTEDGGEVLTGSAKELVP